MAACRPCRGTRVRIESPLARQLQHRNVPRLRRRQKEGHVDVAEIDQVENPPARRQSFSGLRHPILHTPVARRCQRAVVDVGGDGLDGGFAGVDRRLGVYHRCFRRADFGLGGRKLGLGRGQCSSSAQRVRRVVVEVL
jgi:hypothetical protein